MRAFLAEILDGCPVADEAVLIADELASNAVRHSNSGKPGGRFTVRVEVHKPDYLWVEVEDEGSRPDARQASGGQGVAGSNPAVPTQLRGLIRSAGRPFQRSWDHQMAYPEPVGLP